MTTRSPHLIGDVRAAYPHMLATLQEWTAPDPLAYEAGHLWCGRDVRRHMTSWLHTLTPSVIHLVMSDDQRSGPDPSAPVVLRRDWRAGEEATAGGHTSPVSGRGVAGMDRGRYVVWPEAAAAHLVVAHARLLACVEETDEERVWSCRAVSRPYALGRGRASRAGRAALRALARVHCPV